MTLTGMATGLRVPGPGTLGVVRHKGHAVRYARRSRSRPPCTLQEVVRPGFSWVGLRRAVPATAGGGPLAADKGGHASGHAELPRGVNDRLDRAADSIRSRSHVGIDRHLVSESAHDEAGRAVLPDRRFVNEGDSSAVVAARADRVERHIGSLWTAGWLTAWLRASAGVRVFLVPAGRAGQGRDLSFRRRFRRCRVLAAGGRSARPVSGPAGSSCRTKLVSAASMIPYSSKASRSGSSRAGSSCCSSAVTAKPRTSATNSDCKAATRSLTGPGRVPISSAAATKKQPPGKYAALQVVEERLAHRHQLGQARRSRQGGLRDFFGEDPAGLLHGGQLEFLLGAEVRVQAALAHADRRGQVPDRQALQPVDGGQRGGGAQDRAAGAFPVGAGPPLRTIALLHGAAHHVDKIARPIVRSKLARTIVLSLDAYEGKSSDHHISRRRHHAVPRAGRRRAR